MVSIKGRALPQREMGSIKSANAAATRNGQYKKQGRCRRKIRAVSRAGALPQGDPGSKKIDDAAGQHKKAGALPQGDQGSKKMMALTDSIKIGGR